MKITLEIPNGCKKLHFVLLLSDDETKTFGTTDGQFTPMVCEIMERKLERLQSRLEVEHGVRGNR